MSTARHVPMLNASQAASDQPSRDERLAGAGDDAWGPVMVASSGGPGGRRFDVAGGRVDATSGHRGRLLAELAEQAVHAVVPARALREQVVVEQVLQRAVGVVDGVPGEREHLVGVQAAALRTSTPVALVRTGP